jgi:xylulokinase
MRQEKIECALAIDLGTSGPKSALVSTRGDLLDYEFKEVSLKLFPGGAAEQSPHEWWSAIKETAGTVIRRAGLKPEQIIAVNCATQWSGTVPVNRSGEPLTNAIIWLDSRGASYVRELVDGSLKVAGYDIFKLIKWIRLTGGCPSMSGKDPLAHILWLKRERPEIYEQTHKFLEPKDYVNLKLTGKLLASYDSIALHWVTDNRNINRIDYDPGLLKMSGLERDKLPELAPPGAVIGNILPEVADELGISRDVKVVIGSPDVQAAAVGSGAVKDFQGHLYIGTSSWITCHVPFKKTDLFHNIASLPSALPGKYFVANEQETAGACLTYLRDNLFFAQDGMGTVRPENCYTIFDDLAQSSAPGAGGVIFTPWLYGERTPIEDHSVRASFLNQSLNTTRADMIRAVYEGVAYNSRWLLETVERFIRGTMDPIVMIGGGANSAIWRQIHADVFNRTIRQVKDPIQANVRGAGLLAALALGRTSIDEIAQNTTMGELHHPDRDNRSLYDELYAEFRNIYRANRKIFQRLNSGRS